MQTKVLFLDSARSTNGLTIAQAETPTVANGWIDGASITGDAVGTQVGPYGFGLGVTLTNGPGVPGRNHSFVAPTTIPAAGVTWSVFLRRGTLTTLRLQVVDTVAAGGMSVDATWDGTSKWTTGTKVAGALGGVADLKLNNNWQRVTLTAIPGATGVSAGFVAGNAYNFELLMQNLSSSIDIWGVHVQENVSSLHSGDAVTKEFTATFGLNQGDDFVVLVDQVQVPAVRITGGTKSALKFRIETAPAVGVNNIRAVKVPAIAPAYLTGINPNEFDFQSLPEFHPTAGGDRADGDPIVVQYRCSAAGVDGALEDRLNDGLPWVTRQVLDDSDTGATTGAGRKEVTAAAAQSIRVTITNLASDGIFSAAVMG